MYICISVYMYTYVYIHHTHIHHIYIYVYIYIYIYIYIPSNLLVDKIYLIVVAVISKLVYFMRAVTGK